MCKVQLKNARLRPFALFMALFLMNVSWAFAQLTVTGHVKSTSGDPLIGVNVVEKGTTNGTVTDMDGNFSLRVEKGKTLVFSYIGFLSRLYSFYYLSLHFLVKENRYKRIQVFYLSLLEEKNYHPYQSRFRW